MQKLYLTKTISQELHSHWRTFPLSRLQHQFVIRSTGNDYRRWHVGLKGLASGEPCNKGSERLRVDRLAFKLFSKSCATTQYKSKCRAVAP